MFNDLTMAVYLERMHAMMWRPDRTKLIIVLRQMGIIPFPSHDLYRPFEERNRIRELSSGDC
jgi:hypothetical protein